MSATKLNLPSLSALTRYVNPFIGTATGGSHFGFSGDSGDTFPGATYPLGMMQWSPDTTSNLPGGYFYPDTTIKGFSLTHFSGRGCNAYQDIPFMPYVGTITSSPFAHPTNYYSRFSHSNEQAHPGYYSVALDASRVQVQLTVSSHAGFGQFDYPATHAATMLINAGGSINGTSHSSVQIIGAKNEVTGSATSKVGCGSNKYTVYFAAYFDHAFSSVGAWSEARLAPLATRSASSHTGAFVSFDTTRQQSVRVRVGISYVSIANAELNSSEHGSNPDFDVQRRGADNAWNEHLKVIEVGGGSADEKSVFYTALYHTLLHPNVFNDLNGQYRGFDEQVHMVVAGHSQYENIAAWDQYRSLIQLRALLFPLEVSDIAQSLVNDAVQGDGHLPRWEQTNADSHGMTGDGGSIMIAQAYVFGATNFDTKAALVAMNNGQAKIREGLTDYVSLGYVASGTTGNSAAITEEYSIDDFGISMFAQSLGATALAQSYRQRSNNWQHVFDSASGLMQPRTASGQWPATIVPTSDRGFTEGSAAQYSWLVPFNLRTLFTKMGGNAVVIKRLDDFFRQLNAGPVSMYAFMGNEPCFEVPWEYDFAGAPSHTQRVVRAIQMQLFRNAPDGLPGNDDGGAMSSWYIFSALGLYPEIPTVGGFVIGSPLLPDINVHLGNGHTLHITTSTTMPYVQQLLVNKHASTGVWLPLNTFKQDTSLAFTLGRDATNWGTGKNDAPPSYA